MTTEYTLNVNVGDKWRKQWAPIKDMRLCFASSVSDKSGSKTFSNVVAFTNDIAPSVQITWKNKYQMAGSTNKFSNGAKFTASTKLKSVEFGSKTVVAEDWTITTNPSPDAPKAGFLFTNEREAAAVLYREIMGAYSPIYISHTGPLPPDSEEMLVPKETVYVWFSSDYETATMVDQMRGKVQGIEFGGSEGILEATASFTDDGEWILS